MKQKKYTTNDRDTWISMPIGRTMLLLLLFLFVGMGQTSAFNWWEGSNPRAFTKGDGSAGNPYQISEPAHLGYLMSKRGDASFYSKHYILTDDIDMGADNNCQPLFWTGDWYFSGTFDGQGHTIKNFNVQSNDSYGRFGFMCKVEDRGVIKNLILRNCIINTVNPKWYNGVVLGELHGGLIDNVHVVSCTVKGNYCVGGIAGIAYRGTIQNCSVYDSNIMGNRAGLGDSNSDTGGLVGYTGSNVNLLIKNCAFHAQVIAFVNDWHASEPNRSYFGGIIGSNANPNVTLENVISMAWCPNQNIFKGADTEGFGMIIGEGKIPKMINVWVRSDVSYNQATGYDGLLKGARTSQSINTYNNAIAYGQSTMNGYVIPPGSQQIQQFKKAEELNSLAHAYYMNSIASDKDKVWGAGLYRNMTAPMGTKTQTTRIVNGGYLSQVITPIETYNTFPAYVALNDSVTVVAQNRSEDPKGLSSASGITGLPSGSGFRHDKMNRFRVPIKNIGSITLNAEYQNMPYPEWINGVPGTQVPTVEFDVYKKSNTIRWRRGSHQSQEGIVSGWAAGDWFVFRKLASEGSFNSASWGKPIATLSNPETVMYEDKDVEYGKEYIYLVQWGDKMQDGSVAWQGLQSTKPSEAVNTLLDYKVEATLSPGVSSMKVNIDIPNNSTFNGSKYIITRLPLGSYTPKEFIFNSSGNEAIRRVTYEDTDMGGDVCSAKGYQVELTGFAESTPFYGMTFRKDSISARLEGAYLIKPNYKATKGEFPNIVRLKWEMEKPIANAELQFRVYRRVAESGNAFELLHLFSSSEKTIIYNDEQVVAGVNFEYIVEQYSICGSGEDSNLALDNTFTDIGFCQSKGTVTGQISYGTGTSVENVTVAMSRTDLEGTATQYRALRFSGGLTQTKWFMGKKKMMDLFNKSDFSIQFYLNPDGEGMGDVFDLFNLIKVGLQKEEESGRFKLSLNVPSSGLAPQVSDFTIPANHYSHISLVRKGKTMQLIYVDDTKGVGTPDFRKASLVLNEDLLCNSAWNTSAEGWEDTTVGATNTGFFLQLGAGFKGYIDEFRVWNKTLTEDEILKNYDHLLMGSESGLKAYFTFDEGLSQRFFDHSKTNGVFNENHGQIESTSTKSVGALADLPTTQQLGLKGYTDSKGNYVISGVPYSGDGSTYAIIPMFGIHEFQPAQTLRYVGNGSLIHNGTDFKDISSFRMKGYVRYENTDHPVVGASFLIDGVAAIREGKLITTDDNGGYTIDVPIGKHKVTVDLYGHTFENEGKMIINGSDTYDFQNDVSYDGFVDKTLVTVIGRVVGGKIEGDKPLGFGLSHANIGETSFELVPTKDLSLNKTEEIIELQAGRKPVSYTGTQEIKGSATIGTGTASKKIVVKTDPNTGEFVIKVPPIPYKLGNLQTTAASSIDFSEVVGRVPLVNIEARMQQTEYLKDSLEQSGQKTEILVDSLKYNHRIDMVYRTKDIRLELVDLGTPENSGMYGDSIYTYVDNDNNQTKVRLYDEKKEDANKYTLDYPIFTMGDIYHFKVKAYEQYIHPTAPEEFAQWTRVPCEGALLTVKNDLGKMEYDANTDQLSESSNVEVKLDKRGEGVYSFRAGFPNMTAPHTYGLVATLNVDGRNVDWVNNKTFKGIVLGDKPLGVGFVTEGPENADFVLRDPPGSNSYSFIEKGTTTSNSYSYTGKAGEELKTTTTTNLGVKSKVGTGLGVFVMTEINPKTQVKVGFEQTFGYEDKNSWSTSLTTTERIQTSDSPDYVGAMGDVYVGKGFNLYFGKSKQLALVKNSDKFTIAERDAFLMNRTGETTTFSYTQGHIINELIPEWKSLRNGFIEKVSQAEYDRPVQKVKTRYISLLSDTDDNFGEAGYYKVIGGSSLKPNEITRDTVSYYNNKIKNWEYIIAKNEREKISAMTNPSLFNTENRSFDSGTSIEKSKNVVTVHNTSDSYTFDMKLVGGPTTGIGINGVGVFLEIEAKAGGGFSKETSDEDSYTTTYGYVLADGDPGNYFAVDVYSLKDFDDLPDDMVNRGEEDKRMAWSNKFGSMGSPIFRTRGGVTSCPYEDQEVTLYHQPGVHVLSEKTVPLEAPRLSIDVPIVTGIPAGGQGTFTLKLMNESTARQASWYVLRLDEKTNTDGLILSIDGSPLTSAGRTFVLDPKQTLTKTLIVKQSDPGILEYRNINLQFGSACDTELFEAKSIDAIFVQSCSDLTLQITDRLLNTNSLHGDTLHMVSKDYNLQYKNFAGIEVLFRRKGEQDFNLAQKYIVNEKDRTSSSDKLIGGASSLILDYPMTSLYDGSYEFQARTLCTAGSGYIHNETPVITIIKDMKQPTVMGAPSPANGILMPENEISVTYNKSIQGEKITPVNFKVEGVLNGHNITNNVGLIFSGSNVAATEFPLNLENTSFTVEGWFKRTDTDVNVSGELFRVGSGSDQVSLLVKGTGFTVRNGTETASSASVAIDDSWQYFAMSYDATSQTVKLNHFKGKTQQTLINKVFTSPLNLTGRLQLGQQYKGKMTHVSVWNEVRGIEISSRDKALALSGREPRLAGYWPLDEGTGTLAVDKARSRNMNTSGAWFIDPTGQSVAFNGTSQYITSVFNTGITDDNDFTIQFWFKGAKQAGRTLFSIGDGVAEPSEFYKKLSICTSENGEELVLKHNKMEYSIPTGNIMDNNWHQFTLSVQRQGMGGVYVDGKIVQQIAASKFRIVNGEVVLGARKHTVNNTSYTVDKFFNGSIDEVRIWNSALTNEYIRMDMNNRLRGTESGLLLYYPFEKYVNESGILYLKETLEDQVVNSKVKAVAVGGSSLYSSNVPTIREARPVEDLSNYTSYTYSDNKVVISVDPATLIRAEGCILEFTLSDIVDLNGNYQKSPIKWTAFVDMNRLKWETEKVVISNPVLQPYTFKATIVNSSGKIENWVLSGMPSWLNVNKSAGTLNPMEKAELIFTVDNATNIGAYECAVGLSGNSGIIETLPMMLTVTGKRPDWNVNMGDFEHSMNMTAQVQIEGVYQESTDDLIAAFSNGVCVGLASPRYVKEHNAYFLFMNIYGTVSTPVTFKLWEAGTGRIYPEIELWNKGSKMTLNFEPNLLLGTAADPIRMNATDKVEQQLVMNAGWNWLSVNVQSTTQTLLDQYKTSIKKAGIQFKSQTQFLDYTASSNSWIGSLTALDYTGMYMAKNSAAATVVLTGSMIKPSQAPINMRGKVSGKASWNWIGYTPQFVLPVKEALAGVQPKENDAIKSQTDYAMYVGGNWIGSLNYMEPGKGYMYSSNNDVNTTFYYPSQYIGIRSMANKASTGNNTLRWSPEYHQYQFNMTVTAVINIDGKELKNENVELGAFCGEECRGSVMLKYEPTIDRYLAYLMVYGSIGDNISFRCYDSTKNLVLSSGKTISFNANLINGTPKDPKVIDFISTGITPSFDVVNAIYPIPAKDKIFFTYPENEIEQIKIVDVSGRLMFITETIVGNYIDVSAYADGVYLMMVKHKGTIYTHQFMKK